MNHATKALLDFCSHMNDGHEQIPLKVSEILHAVSAMGHSLWRQNVESTDKRQGLRASSIGKPAILLALSHLGYVDDEALTNRVRQIFSFGDWAEAYVLAHLGSFPQVTLDNRQKELRWLSIVGHTDASVHSQGSSTLVDVKTMAGHIVTNTFSKSSSHPYLLVAKDLESLEAKGYVSQAAIYSTALGFDEWAWLLWDKGTFELKVGVLPRGFSFEPYLERAERLVSLFSNLESLEQVFEMGVEAPDPIPHICRRATTEHMVLPESIKYSRWRKVLYEMYEEKDCYSRTRDFVRRKREPDEVLSLLRSVTT